MTVSLHAVFPLILPKYGEVFWFLNSGVTFSSGKHSSYIWFLLLFPIAWPLHQKHHDAQIPSSCCAYQSSPGLSIAFLLGILRFVLFITSLSWLRLHLHIKPTFLMTWKKHLKSWWLQEGLINSILIVFIYFITKFFKFLYSAL